MKQDIRGALEGKNKSTDGLQNTKSGDALVVVLVVDLAVITYLAFLLQKLTDNAHISITKLLTQRNSEGGKLCSKHFDEILHDVGESIDVGLIGELEQLLHDGGNVALHARADDIVTDKRLQSQSSRNTNGEGRVGHAVQDVSVDGEQVVLVREVELLKLLDGVASTSTEVALRGCEVGEDISDKEVFDLVSDGALLAQNNRSQSANHAKSTLLGDMVLLVIGRKLVLVDDGVDKLENFKGLLAAVLGQVDEEVGGGNIGSRGLLEVVELAVEVLIGLLLELLDILLSKAENGEDEVGDKVGQVSLEMRPHLLGSYGFVEEDKDVGEAGSAEPRGLGNPFFDLLQVVLENLGSDVGSEVFGEAKSLVALAGARRVTVSGWWVSRAREVWLVLAGHT